MKHTYSFLAGVASISLTVFLTHSLPGYMFLAGFIVCSLSLVLLVRAIGASRIARFFFYLAKRNSIRLSPHWSSDAKKTVAVPEPSVSLPVRGASETLNGRESRPLRNAYRTGNSPREIRTRRNPSAARNANNPVVVNSLNVLSTVQQDVLSALLNLKVPFNQAEQAVRGSKGTSFDELFRAALANVSAGAGKSRRAVA